MKSARASAATTAAQETSHAASTEAGPRPLRVLVCDDAEASLVHWQHLQELSTADGGRPVARYGAPARSAMEAVLRAAHAPDAILIDWRLPARDGEAASVPLGVWVVEKITRTLGARRPTCVLWTANFDACEALAFCEFGGHHVIDKAAPLAEQLATLRAATDPDPDRRARWQPQAPRIALTADEVLALPYIAAGWPNKMMAQAFATGPRHLSEAVLSQLRSGIKQKLCDGDVRPIPVCVPDAARAADICWVPQQYRDATNNPLG